MAAVLLPLRPARPPLSNELTSSSSSSSLLFSIRYRSFRKFQFRASLSSSSDREEARWLREEQRWLREEQRWQREEARWNSEKEALLSEIAALKSRIGELEREKSKLTISEAGSGLESLLRAIRERVAAAEGGIRVPPVAISDQADVKEMIIEEVRVSEREDSVGRKEVLRNGAKGEDAGAMQADVKMIVEEVRVSGGDDKVGRKRVLKKGAEGDDVRAMQEALQRLGFYCGEEDVEFETFSSGTERAVKTWQASLGAVENGIMSSELLEKLFGLEPLKAFPQEGPINIKEPAKEGRQEREASRVREEEEVEEYLPRVFLLGENRWEEPRRLKGNGLVGKKASSQCVTCRGEGRVMCTECDGTGEPNIEPQFLEWVEEGTKCAYCNGHGFVPCDVCGA